MCQETWSRVDFVPGAVEAGYHRCVCVTNIVRRFREGLWFVKKTKEEAASSSSASARDALGATHLDNAVLFGAEKRNVLLYTEAAAAHNQRWKQNSSFNGRPSYFCDPSLLQSAQKYLHCFACEKPPFTFNEFLLTEIPQNKELFYAGEEDLLKYKRSDLVRCGR